MQSSEQGIQLQSTFAGGLGQYLKNTNRISITVTGALTYPRIIYQEKLVEVPKENVVSACFSAQAKLFRFDKTNLTATASVLPALSDSGRVHLNLNASYYAKVWGNLDFSVSFYGNWDTRPPTGFSHSDYGTSTGLNWSFGNR